MKTKIIQIFRQWKKELKGEQSGFTLVEVIVGLAMMVLVATASLSLASNTIRTETFNEKRLIAYNLAQEILEETRRQRDSGWIDLKSDTRWLKEGELGWLTEIEQKMYEDVTCIGNNPTECTLEINKVTYKITKTMQPVSDFRKLHHKGATVDPKDPFATMADFKAQKLVVNIAWKDQLGDENFEVETMLTDWKTGG